MNGLKSIRHPRFLVQCAKWIGEGPHLYLLEVLLDLGYDISGVVGDFQDWPALSSPNWISESHVPDPFFIEYFQIVCEYNQGKLNNLLTWISGGVAREMTFDGP